VKFNITNKQFTVEPTYFDIVDKYLIRIDIFDIFKATNTYLFSLTIYNSTMYDSIGTRVKNLTKYNLN